VLLGVRLRLKEQVQIAVLVLVLDDRVVLAVGQDPRAPGLARGGDPPVVPAVELRVGVRLHLRPDVGEQLARQAPGERAAPGGRAR
jgi:hypothetical protein